MNTESVRKVKKGAQRKRGSKGGARSPKVRVLKLRIPPGQQVSPSYLRLVVAFPIRPIRSEDDLDAATTVLDKLGSRLKPLDASEKDYLESLTNEVRRYEEQAHEMPNVAGAAVLRHLMDAREATQTEVALATHIPVSTISQVLAGKRKLNLQHIAKLAVYFHVKPGVFLESPR